METFINLSKAERAQLFQEATARFSGIEDPIIMEKDFWVCWVLDQLYSISELGSNITFKGGTSLSKCYGIIERFSEDCDLTIDKDFIGIVEDNDPRVATTKSQRKKRLDKLNKLVEVTVNEKIKVLLSHSFEVALSSNFKTNEWRLVLDEEDSQSLLFYYPASLETSGRDGYIAPAVKLEFGARADRTPAQNIKISPYIESSIPEIFDRKTNIEVNTLSSVRTFWEKVTLLHAEYHRSADKNIPKRLFRHYYDIAMLDQHDVTQEALKKIELLDMVVQNKKTFFHSSWAGYDTAAIGTLKLSPNECFVAALKKDHRDMEEMFFGEAPSFDRVMDSIDLVEKKINGKI